MGLEFPSRTDQQRETVTHFIEFLTSRPGTLPELLISPTSLVADENQFATGAATGHDHLEDPLLDLLRSAQTLTKDQFLAELHRQRNPEAVASS